MIEVNYKWSEDGLNWTVASVAAVPLAWADMKRVRKGQAKAVKQVLKLANGYNNFTALNSVLEQRVRDLSADLCNANNIIQLQWEQLQVARLSWFVAYHVEAKQVDLVTGDKYCVLDSWFSWSGSDEINLREMSPMQISYVAAKHFFGRGWRVGEGASEPHHTPDDDDGDIPF